MLFKAENGGGGRGMRIARAAGEVDNAYAEAQAEARAAFGGDRVYLEKLIEGGRHVEIQVLGDRYGRAVHFGERDCTVQRNHQKLIEESPSPALSPEQRANVCDAAARAAAKIGYVGAGTMEMLLGPDGVLRFMEMNCRLQVEHTVSEQRSGKDLVRAQLEIAAGRVLPWAQSDLALTGHAIECRINAEDPANDFAPAPGTISAWQPPTGDGIRVDTTRHRRLRRAAVLRLADREGRRAAATRDAAIAKLVAALEAFRIEGVPTTIPMHLKILERSVPHRPLRHALDPRLAVTATSAAEKSRPRPRQRVLAVLPAVIAVLRALRGASRSTWRRSCPAPIFWQAVTNFARDDRRSVFATAISRSRSSDSSPGLASDPVVRARRSTPGTDHAVVSHSATTARFSASGDEHNE